MAAQVLGWRENTKLNKAQIKIQILEAAVNDNN